MNCLVIITGGGGVAVRTSGAVIAAWLNASQRSRNGVGMNWSGEV